MAFTQADLDRLDAAIAASELEVENADGTRVRYASFADLKARRDFVAGQVVGSGAAPARSTTSYRYDFTTRRE